MAPSIRDRVASLGPQRAALTLDERRQALAALSIGQAAPAGGGERLERTGREVKAGGKEARLLVKRFTGLGYQTPNGRHRVKAVPGDVVLLDEAEADRLDGLGVTLPADTDLDALYAEAQVNAIPDAPAGSTVTVLDGDSAPKSDEDLAAMGAAELVAHVGQHADDAERVRDLELARPKKGQRKTVLDATDPEKLEEARQVAQEEADARAASATVAQVLDGDEPDTEED